VSRLRGVNGRSLVHGIVFSQYSIQDRTAEAQASKERQIAEKKFEESNTPEDALNLDLKRLDEYYVINQAQARSSFRWQSFRCLLVLELSLSEFGSFTSEAPSLTNS
jgi:hypothetical protein